MEQQKLPNGVLIIVLGIFGFLCCCTGILGVIPAGIGFYLASKSGILYKENPDAYDNFSQIKTGKIICLIALILSALMTARWGYVIFEMGGVSDLIEEFRKAYAEGMEQYQ